MNKDVQCSEFAPALEKSHCSTAPCSSYASCPKTPKPWILKFVKHVTNLDKVQFLTNITLLNLFTKNSAYTGGGGKQVVR